MTVTDLAPGRLAHTPSVERTLSDRAAFMWGVFWTVLLVSVLAFLWVIGNPLEAPLWTAVVFTGILISSALSGRISRIDATLLLSISPAMLFIANESTNTAAALAVWGTAYFVGAWVRLNDLGDAAERAAYMFGCGLAAIGVLEWLTTAGLPFPVSAAFGVGVYVATRLVISAIRLPIVTPLGWKDAFRALSLSRVLLFWLGISLVVIVGHAFQRITADQYPRMGMPWGGAITIFLIGIAAFALGMFLESKVLTIQLSGTLKAALELPWAAGTSIEQHALRFARLTLPRYSIEFRPRTERNMNEIVAPLSDGYLVARRGAIQPPFLAQDQRVIDAIAHIADTMAAAQRERERLSAEATTDILTGLPNYRGFREALTQMASAGGLAVVYVDLDGFKAINDRYGHETGNTVLRTLATRMRTRLPGTDVVARLGGDEFVLILTGIASEAEGHLRAEALFTDISTPVLVGDAIIPLTVSHGLAFAESGDTDITALVESADARMYASRGRHVGGAASSVSRSGRDVSDLVKNISRAIEERRLTFAYQPIVDRIEDRVVALEVLVRPNEPALDGLPAEVIVNEARRLRLLTDLSTHMLETAVADLERFQRAAPDLVELNVNIDIEQVTDPVFIADLLQVQNSEKVRFTLELCETSLNRTSESTNCALERLRSESGVRIALDDFGSSSSTLLAVVESPVDVLKIDKSMVRGIRDRKPQVVMRSMARLAHNLDVKMVVEGVEDEETYEELVRAGVRYMQGFRFGAPLSPDELTDRLSRHGLRAHIP